MFELFKKAKHVYLNTVPGGRIFNYRGVVGKNDDPESFKRLMEKKGHQVLILKEFGGRKIDAALNTLEA